MIRQALKKTATPLNFGFVLLLFGVAGHAPIAMGQATGTFTPTGNLTGDRWFHTATLLKKWQGFDCGGPWLPFELGSSRHSRALRSLHGHLFRNR